MQDEREPDIMGSDDDALEEKVREMMDPKAKEPEADKPADSPVADEVGTAPVLVGLPLSKEPLKIKIIKEEPIDEEQLDAVPEIAAAKSKTKKKITVKHDETGPVIGEESDAAGQTEEAVDEIPGAIAETASSEAIAAGQPKPGQ